MKKHLLTALFPAFLFFALLVMVSGCDWIRASLGKPTSADLAAIRQAKEAREQAVRDSIAAAKAEQERIAAEEAAAAVAAAAVPKRYYAVAGAFKEDAGAQIFEEKLRENGFQVRTFDFKSGLKVVCVNGSDSLEVVRRDLAALKRLGIAPTDPWIYNTNQKLHKQI